MNDKEFLKLAIRQSEASVKDGKFPAGAVVTVGEKVVASGVSDSFPGYQHAECRAIDEAFQKIGVLTGSTLYTSMEPCLMCLARAYWSGIRKIVYAVSKKSISKEYYEGTHDGAAIAGNMNEKVNYIHLKELESEAIKIVKEWEKNQ